MMSKRKPDDATLSLQPIVKPAAPAAKKRSRDNRALHSFLNGKVEADPWTKQLHLQVTRNPFASNPHSLQTDSMRVPFKSGDESAVKAKPPCYIDFPFCRILTPDAPKSEIYISKSNVEGQFSVSHWGQMKLLMSEIEFLTPYFGESLVVVYVGAAPGVHIPLLAELFDTFAFELYDPAPFGIQETEKIRIFNVKFTADLASEIFVRFKDNPSKLIFISDIRTAPSQDEDALRETDTGSFCRISQARIKRDMDSQKEWHLLMQPRRSMLKFRLPWEAGSTTYLAGSIHFSVWGPIYSHETRLITFERPNHLGESSYDHITYMLQLSYFNTVTRTCLYSPDPYHEDLEYSCHHRCREVQTKRQPFVTAIDHCYDCTAHLHIVTRYVLAKFGADVYGPHWSLVSLSDEAAQVVSETVDFLEDRLFKAQYPTRNE